jgi:7-cyano-7-deazaguanine synthase in queuosine biosynthesis
MTDPIADLLTRIRNAQLARKPDVSVSNSKLKTALVKVLKDEGYVAGFNVVTDGAKHGTPFGDTWSCYKGGVRHCGRCGTCVERREAFHLAGISDPTDYEDPDFWVAATSAYAAQEVK